MKVLSRLGVSLGGRLENINVKDAEKYSPTEEKLTLCGDGKVPIPEIVELMLVDNYDGFFRIRMGKGVASGTFRSAPNIVVAVRLF